MISNKSFIGKYCITVYNYFMANNVYIHIPFCKQKCNYCSFVSFPRLDEKEKYLNALCDEISAEYKLESLKTLYFGGGTPSLLGAGEFDRLISLFNTDIKTEITAELNPENLTLEYLLSLRNVGINRISLGCQTFNDDILGIIGRRHSGNQVKNAVKMAKMAGFNNISLDFIYGLPSQTVEDFISDLKNAVELQIQHISLYGLKIEDGCYFYNHIPNNLPDDELQAEMYLQAIKLLKENGFCHYEISNFSLPGFESKHNLNYWNNNSYYGFGVAAHGYINGVRYANTVIMNQYLQNPLKHTEQRVISAQEQLEEEIFLGLRRIDGIDTTLINSKYNIIFDTKYEDIIQKYIFSKHLEKTEKGYKLTDNGILVSNCILAEFLD